MTRLGALEETVETAKTAPNTAHTEEKELRVYFDKLKERFDTLENVRAPLAFNIDMDRD